jgi:hypothetical protein
MVDGIDRRPHPYQGSAHGPVSAGSRRQPARTTSRWRPLETVANRSEPMACGPNVDQVGPSVVQPGLSSAVGSGLAPSAIGEARRFR